MNAANFTLTSTVLAAALGLALGLSAVPALAGPPDVQGCHPDHKDEECPVNGGGDGEDPIVYTAQLTAGAFVFAPMNTVPVTPNQRENVLRSEENLNLDIDDSPARETWVEMFATCDELWEGPVEDFFVGEDDWSIDKAGGVRVVFRHIESDGAEFRFQLIGNEIEFDHSFLPEPGFTPADTRTYTLEQFAITAKSLPGGSGGTKFCRTLGGEFGNPLFLMEASILTITAVAEAPAP